MILYLLKRLVWLLEKKKYGLKRDCSICKKGEAVAFVQYGEHAEQQGNLCQEHLEEVWQRSSSGVMAGILFWNQGPVR